MSRKVEITKMLADKLSASASEIEQQWRNPQGTSTRHFVIDGLLSSELCREIYEAFPKDANGFCSRESFREKKRTSANLDAYSQVLSDVTYAFQGREIVDLLCGIINYERIEPDPKLYAGGLSMMFEGDFLNPHIDNSHDSERKKFRRLNLLYYVSPDWALGNGGNFELWNEGRTEPKTIVSCANRFVVMETNKTSWHSVSPVKVNLPRCCVSNYYFSEESPDKSEYFHVTSFSGRPGERLKSAFGVIDNTVRNLVSVTLKTGRGRKRINKPQE